MLARRSVGRIALRILVFGMPLVGLVSGQTTTNTNPAVPKGQTPANREIGVAVVSRPTSVSTPAASSSTSGLPHFAVGGNWTTGITVVNTSATPANYFICFYDDNGNPAALPFTSGSTTRLSGALPAFGSVYVEAANPSAATISGWGQVTADDSIVVRGLLRSSANSFVHEATVTTSAGTKAFELPFDFTDFAAGVPLSALIAMANLDGAKSTNHW